MMNTLTVITSGILTISPSVSEWYFFVSIQINSSPLFWGQWKLKLKLKLQLPSFLFSQFFICPSSSFNNKKIKRINLIPPSASITTNLVEWRTIATVTSELKEINWSSQIKIWSRKCVYTDLCVCSGGRNPSESSLAGSFSLEASQ